MTTNTNRKTLQELLACPICGVQMCAHSQEEQDNRRAIIAECNMMRLVVASWEARAMAVGKKGKKLDEAREHFFAGAVTALYCAGKISPERINIISFMFQVGRLDEMCKLWKEGK